MCPYPITNWIWSGHILWDTDRISDYVANVNIQGGIGVSSRPTNLPSHEGKSDPSSKRFHPVIHHQIQPEISFDPNMVTKTHFDVENQIPSTASPLWSLCLLASNPRSKAISHRQASGSVDLSPPLLDSDSYVFYASVNSNSGSYSLWFQISSRSKIPKLLKL